MKKIVVALCLYVGVSEASLVRKVVLPVTSSVRLQILRTAARSASAPSDQNVEALKKSARTSRCVGRKNPFSRKPADRLGRLESEVRQLDKRIENLNTHHFWTQVAVTVLLWKAIID